MIVITFGCYTCGCSQNCKKSLPRSSIGKLLGYASVDRLMKEA